MVTGADCPSRARWAPRRRWWSKPLALAMISALVGACTGTNAPGGNEPIRIGVIELFANPFFAEARAGMDDAAAHAGVDLIINNAGADAAAEAKFVSNYLSQGVDAIVASAVSPTGSLASLLKAKVSGIPVICYDTCVNPPEDRELVRAFVTSDNRQLGATTGVQAANYARDELGSSATVVMLTCEQFDVCKQRRQGLDEQLATVGATLVDEQEGFEVDKATPVASAMLAAHPDVQVFIAQNEDAILAAAAAITSRGLQGKVAVFGIDINPQVAELLLDPVRGVRWTTGQDPYQMGYRSVMAAVAAVRGDDVGDFYQYTNAPTFSSADPTAVRAYLDVHP